MEEYSYKIYVTDALQCLGKGMYLVNRWHEPEITMDRDAEEIVDDVVRKAGLVEV